MDKGTWDRILGGARKLLVHLREPTSYNIFFKEVHAGLRNDLKLHYQGRELNKKVFEAVGQLWRERKNAPEIKITEPPKKENKPDNVAVIPDEELIKKEEKKEPEKPKEEKKEEKKPTIEELEQIRKEKNKNLYIQKIRVSKKERQEEMAEYERKKKQFADLSKQLNSLLNEYNSMTNKYEYQKLDDQFIIDKINRRYIDFQNKERTRLGPKYRNYKKVEEEWKLNEGIKDYEKNIPFAEDLIKARKWKNEHIKEAEKIVDDKGIKGYPREGAVIKELNEMWEDEKAKEKKAKIEKYTEKIKAKRAEINEGKAFEIIPNKDNQWFEEIEFEGRRYRVNYLLNDYVIMPSDYGRIPYKYLYNIPYVFRASDISFGRNPPTAMNVKRAVEIYLKKHPWILEREKEKKEKYEEYTKKIKAKRAELDEKKEKIKPETFAEELMTEEEIIKSRAAEKKKQDAKEKAKATRARKIEEQKEKGKQLIAAIDKIEAAKKEEPKKEEPKKEEPKKNIIETTIEKIAPNVEVMHFKLSDELKNKIEPEKTKFNELPDYLIDFEIIITAIQMIIKAINTFKNIQPIYPPNKIDVSKDKIEDIDELINYYIFLNQRIRRNVLSLLIEFMQLLNLNKDDITDYEKKYNDLVKINKENVKKGEILKELKTKEKLTDDEKKKLNSFSEAYYYEQFMKSISTYLENKIKEIKNRKSNNEYHKEREKQNDYWSKHIKEELEKLAKIDRAIELREKKYEKEQNYQAMMRANEYKASLREKK